MALSKSGKSGSNVLKMDAVRRKRAISSPPKASDQEAAGSVVSIPSASNCATKASMNRRRGDKTTPKESKTDKKAATAPRVSNRRFDREKVDRIKLEIAEGNYEINFLQVADKFIEHERYS